MGVNLSDILKREKRTMGDFKGRWMAFDAYNTLYQFLSSIRQPDGTPLMDSQNRVTSHLTGLLFRTSNILDAEIKPVFVFDGKPHELKSDTLKGRRRIKEKAQKEWEEALEEGDLEKAKSKAQQTSILTQDMVETSKELLGYFGVPCVQAPADGEAQASHMAEKKHVWASASQDFDSLLFGTPRLIRNLTVSGKRKLPKRSQYVVVEPEEIDLNITLTSLELSRAQLVDVAILVGTDFNPGVKGIGAKTGVKLLKKHENLETVLKEKEIEMENFQEVREIFLKPDVTDEYEVKMGNFSQEKILKLLVDEYEFSESRVNSALEKVKIKLATNKQKKLDQWF